MIMKTSGYSVARDVFIGQSLGDNGEKSDRVEVGMDGKLEP